MPASRGYSQPRIKPTSFTSPALAGGFFTINVSFMRRENKSFEMPKGSSGNPRVTSRLKDFIQNLILGCPSKMLKGYGHMIR